MKLLNRTIRNYLVYSILLVLLCTPLFYYSIQHLVVREMDKILKSHKKDFTESLFHLRSKNELEFFPLMNKEFILAPVDKLPNHDEYYTQYLYDSISNEDIPHRVYKTGITLQGSNYELLIRESMVSNIALISSIMQIEFIMLSLLLVGLYFINRNLSRIIWDPFYIILDKLKHFNIDKDDKIDLPDSSTAEFKELTLAISELVRKNSEVYQNQKEFTENASHELQTPLAICRSKLELLVQTKELTQEQAELAGSLLQATDRIARLNKSLLLLSKIENRQFPEVEEVNTNIIIEKLLETYFDQAEEKGITFKKDYSLPFIVKGNPVLLDILFSNLISNAIRHSGDNGLIEITEDKNSVTISNTGSPLKHPEKIFLRFQREANRDVPGSGLGLSIVKKICDMSGYLIIYRFSNNMHHFSVSFK